MGWARVFYGKLLNYMTVVEVLAKGIILTQKKMSIKDFTILAKLGTYLHHLGEGAYSTVYKVERKADSQQYALKKVKLGNLSDK